MNEMTKRYFSYQPYVLLFYLNYILQRNHVVVYARLLSGHLLRPTPVVPRK